MGRRIAVIGAGSWGTALAIIAARRGHEVTVWSRNSAVVAGINQEHFNPVYLKGSQIPAGVRATNAIAAALETAELVIFAAPSHAARGLLAMMTPGFSREQILVSAAKGIEIESGKRISEIVSEMVPSAVCPRFVCLSGPSFAQEVIANHPTAIVAASADEEAGRLVQSALSFESLRIYTNDDVIGTEVGGSVKNVMAIAAGMVAGLGFGANSIAALITRGLAEMTRLALHAGGRAETMMGLAGLGDLVLTCTGSLSRNRFVGHELGQGRSLNDITAGMNEVAEGIKTTLAVNRSAKQLGLELPITREVHSVLYEGKLASDAVNELMMRPLRAERNR